LIALRTLTSAMSIRCCHRSFGSHLNANDRVSLSVVAHEPLGHSPPAFLFLSSTISKSGEDFHPPAFRRRRKQKLDPLKRRQPVHQLHRDASRSVALSSSARPVQ